MTIVTTPVTDSRQTIGRARTGRIAEAAIAFRISSRSPILTIGKTDRESQRIVRTVLRTIGEGFGRRLHLGRPLGKRVSRDI